MDRGQNGVDEIGGNGHQEREDEPQNFDVGDAHGAGSSFHREVYANMPVGRYASDYKMDHQKKSYAYIFNHENFEVNGLKKRSGTNKDSTDLHNVLDSLGFDVHEFKDLTLADINGHIEELAKKDHSERNCVLVAVLSHGEMGLIYSKDLYYKPENLWSNFTADKCPTLAGKPKMFIIQACQGDKLDSGVHVRRTETDGESHLSYKLPVQADFLMVFSTVKGYYSWRNTTHGSWFIQSLCQELKTRAYSQDLLTILTFVSQRVAIDYESNTPDNQTMHRQKQIPCVMSMLTRLIRFKKIG